MLEKLSAGYGEGIALDECSFALAEGETLAVLGHNGAGKSTLLLTVMGQTRVRSGSMRWRGADLVRVPRHRRAALGLGWVPQEREIFHSLSVEENLTVAARPGRWDLARVYGLFPRLRERRGHWGDELSGGEQQMLAIARALMLNPRLLLLDEPLEGLAPVMAQEVCAGIERMVVGEGQSLVLVEQHVQQALALTQRCIVLERGRVVHAAGSRELAREGSQLDRWLSVRQRIQGEPA